MLFQPVEFLSWLAQREADGFCILGASNPMGNGALWFRDVFLFQIVLPAGLMIEPSDPGSNSFCQLVKQLALVDVCQSSAMLAERKRFARAQTVSKGIDEWRTR